MYGGTLEADLLGPRGAAGQYVDLPADPGVVAPLFRQGLAQLWGFNGVEARRNFASAAVLAPDCALCHWGIAMSLAPNINYLVEDQEALNAAAARAQELARQQPALLPKTRRLIESAAALVADPGSADKPSSPAREAYANTTCAPLADPYGTGAPGPDADLLSMCAAARMARSPWDYYTGVPQGESYPLKPEFEAVKVDLEEVLGRNASEATAAPLHSLALHLYIHLMEPSNAPGAYRMDAASVADRLVSLPAVAVQGHLTHMPAHLFMRLGRYSEAAATSLHALDNNRRYLQQCLHPYAYGHNLKLLVAASRAMGVAGQALGAARESQVAAAGLEETAAGKRGCVDCAGPGNPEEVLTLVRFGRWSEALQLGVPPSATLPEHLAAHHYARAVSYYATGSLAEGDAEAGLALNATAAALNASAHSVAGAAVPHELAAVRAWRAQPRDTLAAIAGFQAAAVAIDMMPYMEPPRWYYSPRHCLGYALLNAPDGAGRNATAALAAFERDLALSPDNGWSLLGAAQAWDALGDAQAAAEFRARFTRAWRHADTALDTPCPQLAAA